MAIGILRVRDDSLCISAISCDSHALLRRHHSTSSDSPSSSDDLSLEAQKRPGLASCRPAAAARHSPCAPAPYSGSSDEPMTDASVCASSPQARFRPAGDVEDLVGDVGASAASTLARAMSWTCTKSIVCVAVAEDHRRLAGRDALHPADEHFGVGAVHVHARSVDVEVAQRDVVQSVHVGEAAQQPFVERLGGAVDRAVVVRMMVLPWSGSSRRGRAPKPTKRRRPSRRPRERPPRAR